MLNHAQTPGEAERLTMNANGGGGSPEQAGVEIAGQPITANNSSLSATSAAGGASAAAPATISSSDLAAAMQAQGLPASAQSQILAAVLASHQQQQLQHGAGSTVDMASVLAKIQALEREKADLRTKLEMTNTDLSKYREVHTKRTHALTSVAEPDFLVFQEKSNHSFWGEPNRLFSRRRAWA